MTLPAIDSFDTYGGLKIDYSPVEDPDTDLSADEGNQCRASTAAMTRTAPRIYIAFSTDSGTATITDWNSVYGNAFADTPTISQTVPGLWAIGLPASVTDFVGTTQAINIRRAHGQVEDMSNRWTVQCKRVDANGLNVAIFDDSDSLMDPDGFGDVVVWVY